MFYFEYKFKFQMSFKEIYLFHCRVECLYKDIYKYIYIYNSYIYVEYKIFFAI